MALLFLFPFRGLPVMACAYAPARDELRQSVFSLLRLLEQVYCDDIPGSAAAMSAVTWGEPFYGTEKSVRREVESGRFGPVTGAAALRLRPGLWRGKINNVE